MKNCTDCAYADWNRTPAGKLHPSGDGKCTYAYAVPPLPACMYWLVKPEPYGRAINRKKQLTDHCVYFVRKS